MLGYALDIEKLYIYDPACRPVYTTDAPASTAKKRRGGEGKVPVYEPTKPNYIRVSEKMQL